MATDQKLHLVFASVEQLGHFMPLVPFIREMLERGHRVTLFVADNAKYKTKIQEFGLQSAEVVQMPLLDKEGMKALGFRTVLSKGGPLAVLSEGLFASITNHYKGTDSQINLPSVIIADFFATAAKDAGDALGVPVVNIFPNPIGVGPIGFLLHPSLRGTGQQLRTIFARFMESLFARLFLSLRNRERRARNLSPMIEQDVWPCDTMKRPMINTWGLGYEYAFLQSPLLTFVGPSEPRSFPEVSGDLATWFEQQTRPIVYVAFGTQHHFTQTSANLLFDELKQLSNVAVLWSLPADQQALIKGTSENLRFETFVPQYAVLQHPKTSVFVSHCGANSVGESILAGTPLVCCPMMADQPANAARVQSAGIGVQADGGIVGVKKAVLQVLDNTAEYEKNVLKLKRILLSNGGAKRGADIIEAVATCGYEHAVPLGQRVSLARTTICLLSLATFCFSLKRCFRA